LNLLDPGLRRDDGFGINSFSTVIPAQAGIQCLALYKISLNQH
jgi:hypothetical protein